MSPIRTDLSLAEATGLWRQALQQANWFETRKSEMIDVVDAIGRVTSEPVIAVRSVPHYNGAAMDGFAICSADVQRAAADSRNILRILKPGETMSTGTATPVDTGDALPPGTDSVVMKEHAEVIGGDIILSEAVPAGQHVRRIGEDITADGAVLPAGRTISPSDIAAALAAGNDRIEVVSRVRVTVIPTGDEIVDTAKELPPGQIRDINSHMLAALFRSWGACVRRHPVVPDDPGSLREALIRSMTESDLVVTNAGTSSGTEDFTEQVLSGIGEVCCHGVAIRPGRPVMLAVIEGKPVIGLPGYPVSCMLTAELFLHDLICEFHVKELPERRLTRARLSQDIHSKQGFEEFVRISLSPGDPYPIANPLPRGASLISSLTQANGLLRVSAECSEMIAGEIVDVELFAKY